MSNEETKVEQSDAALIKLPELDGTIEEIPVADLDDVAGGAKCSGITCTKTEIKVTFAAEL